MSTPPAGRPDTAPAAGAGDVDVTADGGVPADGVRYSTVVTAVGALIPEFRAQGLLVFFNETAPEELHDFCLLHSPSVVHSIPRPGDVVELDGAPFVVTSVGDVVNENLIRLGHMSLKADGSTTAPLPGDVCVEVGELPELGVGSTMRILARPVD
jgi:glucitol/sorbitol PTS system EIIA component